ncbi:hypothetical protein RJT34_03710 [Clitoria ternatea]|uniref:Uncharacterized protein n=1 Tax=Clitoria ternatea TaxID=43366 RepID=A0AAN9KM48_CLITE
MDAIRSSRKRNNPFGTLTRSRSQLLLHRNRSGQLRSDPPARGAATTCKKTKRDNDQLPCPLAKDLRARRVYSPLSSASDLIENALPKGSAADLGLASSPSAGNCDVKVGTKIEATESLDLGLSCEDRSFDRGIGGSLQVSSKVQDRKRIDGINGGDCSGKIDDLDVKPILTTPPDAVICGNSKNNEDDGNEEEEVRVEITLSGNAELNASKGLPRKDSQRNDSALKSKSVIGPRFQGKLFKAPGSVNYKRLFPFLMDAVGYDSGAPKFDRCQKGEEGVDRQELQLPLSSQSQEACKHGFKADSCTLHDANGSKLTSSQDLIELPMQLDTKEVISECLSVPSVDDKCLDESKVDATVTFLDVKDVCIALPNDAVKQHFSHLASLDYTKSTDHNDCKQLGVLNKECIPATPAADMHDNSEVNVDQLESMTQDGQNAKPMELSRSTQDKAGEGSSQKADKGKDSTPKSKPVPRQHLHRKLFKTPGSVSYKRLLPFLMDLTKDDSGTSKFDHQTPQKDEVDGCAKRFQFHLSSQGEEASTDKHKTDSDLMNGMVESNAMENIVLVNPPNEASQAIQPKLTSSQEMHELPMLYEGLTAPSVYEHIEKVEIGSKDACSGESKLDLYLEIPDDFHYAKNVANVVHNVGFKQVPNGISGEHKSESPSKDQNMLYNNDDVSDLTPGHHSRKEEGFTMNYVERKQLELVNFKEHESVSGCPPEGLSLSQVDPNILDAEENGTSSHASSRTNDSTVLNLVRVSNIDPRSLPDKIVSKKSEMEGHDKAGNVLKGIVFDSRMPSKGGDRNVAREIINGSESKITQILNRCPRVKSLKLAGSFSYKRLLPFLLNTVKDNSVNDHCPELPNFLSRSCLLPTSASSMPVTPLSDSNGCVPMQHCPDNSGTRPQTGKHACDINHDSASPNSTDPSISVNGIDIPPAPLTPVISEVIEEKVQSALSESPVFSEVRGNSSSLIPFNEKAPETHECYQSLSQPKVLELEQVRVPAIGLEKGILKRNPRGCRGLCTCLNCASFRLHAERAFEFSRNQFLDAEEVAQDLMKELSHLRNMLERSTGIVNNNPVFDETQVKEACRKSFAAEQEAKDRLSVMNDDLNIHCRIKSLQRPRVTFADYVEEKVIHRGR